jgi:hypothetical protein
MEKSYPVFEFCLFKFSLLYHSFADDSNNPLSSESFWGACTGRQNIWGQVDIGSTASPLGVYKIVAALQYLAHWTRHVYAPWFFANALGVKSR